MSQLDKLGSSAMAAPYPPPQSGGGEPPKAVEGAVASPIRGVRCCRTEQRRERRQPPPPCFAWSPSPVSRGRIGAKLRVPRRLSVAAALLVAAGALAPLLAADLGGAAPAETEGLPCEAPLVQTYPTVWLGHFSGGYSHYLGPGESIVLDWRDEKLCFPSRASCNHYVFSMRREFHRPEGYFTCLPIR